MCTEDKIWNMFPNNLTVMKWSKISGDCFYFLKFSDGTLKY